MLCDKYMRTLDFLQKQQKSVQIAPLQMIGHSFLSIKLSTFQSHLQS